MFRCVRGEGEVWADRTFLYCPTDNDGSITGSLMKQSLGRRDDKPRTMVASRHGAGRPGGREEREPGGVGARAVAAKHRVLPPCGTRGAHGRGRTQRGDARAHAMGSEGCARPRGARAKVRDAMPRTAPRRGGAMGTSRPTAMPHERGAHNGTVEQGTGGAHGNGTAPRGTGGAHAI